MHYEVRLLSFCLFQKYQKSTKFKSSELGKVEFTLILLVKIIQYIWKLHIYYNIVDS